MILKEFSLWSAKLKEGIRLAHSFYEDHGAVLPKNIKKIAFVGMGGSGIAGRIIKTFLDRKGSVVSCVVDSPVAPQHIDTETLAFVVSYSGNTWETLDVLSELADKFIPTVVMTHGGMAAEKAEVKDIPLVLLPESVAPRAALGHILGFVLGLLDLKGVLNGKAIVEEWCKEADKYIPSFVEAAFFKDFLNIADGYEFFHVWGISQDSAAVAYRATTQFNENSKIQAVYNSFPELCHNLLVGISGAKNVPLVVFFYTDFLPAHLSMGIQAVDEILKEKRVVLYKPPILGDTFEGQIFNMILWADFASYYLGKARGVEVEAVKIIDELKKRQKSKGIN